LLRFRIKLIVFLLLGLLLLGGWIYWNRPVPSDLASFAPADCLSYFEANDLPQLLTGVEDSQAWRSLSGPIGARPNILMNPWLVRVARWVGIGSADAVLLARSQVAVVFTGASTDAAGPTLTIRPLATLVIETHTSERRMRTAMERRIDEFASRVYGNPQRIRKELGGVELNEWAPSKNDRQIVAVFLGSAVIVGNSEAAVMNCVEAKRGKRAALAGEQHFEELRQSLGSARTPVFGFVSKAGLRSAAQGYFIYKSGASADAVASSGVLADTLGNLVEGLGCSSDFVDGLVEDRCFVTLTEGVAERLRTNMTPLERMDLTDLPFVPADTYSVSLYHLQDVEGLWRDVNAVVSSHSDVVGAMATHAILRSLFKPYGVDDAEAFVHAVGTRIETVRLDDNSPAVLIAECLDRPTLRKIAERRLGQKAVTETVNEFELLRSSDDNWAVSFADNHFLSGPTESVRSCLQARSESKGLSSVENFRRSERLIDVSLPLTTATFTKDQTPAISFVEVFSEADRPTFSTNASVIERAKNSFPYAVSVVTLKGVGFEWTSRSTVGIGGAILTVMAPEKSK
jgi:hypothetical protein